MVPKEAFKKVNDCYNAFKVKCPVTIPRPGLVGRKPTRELQIINTNKCKVTIHSIYSGQQGRDNVQKDWNKHYRDIEAEVAEPIKELTKTVTEEESLLIKDLYKGLMRGLIEKDQYLVVREFNQPARNIMSDTLMNLEKVYALFCRRPDKDQIDSAEIMDESHSSQ